MATAGEMTTVIADALSRPQATVRSYYAVLRKAGLISTTGRGKSAQHLSSLDVARILIVMLSADSLQEGPAVTELVGDLEHIQFSRKQEFLGSIRFEDALAHVIEFKAAEFHGRMRPECPLLGDLSSENLQVRVTATHLRGEIIAEDEFWFQHVETNFPAMVTPDDWDEVSERERILVRSVMEGMSVTRAIDEIAIRVIAGAMP